MLIPEDLMKQASRKSIKYTIHKKTDSFPQIICYTVDSLFMFNSTSGVIMFQNFMSFSARCALITAVAVVAVVAISEQSHAQTQVPAQAQEGFMPASTELDIPVISASADANEQQPGLNDITHPPLRLTPDKSTIIELSDAAGSIIVGNPAHLNILADSAKRLIVVPRAQGASFFTVLGKDGNVLMQRHVIVGSTSGADKKYVRVRRVCPGGSGNCQQTSVYYCPDMCHEISTEQLSSGGGNVDTAEAGSDLKLNVSDRENGENAESQSENSQLPPPPPAPETLSGE